jgi:hypothetical protein
MPWNLLEDARRVMKRVFLVYYFMERILNRLDPYLTSSITRAQSHLSPELVNASSSSDNEPTTLGIGCPVHEYVAQLAMRLARHCGSISATTGCLAIVLL